MFGMPVAPKISEKQLSNEFDIELDAPTESVAVQQPGLFPTKDKT
jgi:hypothetical protein